MHGGRLVAVQAEIVQGAGADRRSSRPRGLAAPLISAIAVALAVSLIVAG